METFKFNEVIDVVKVSTCATCSAYTYTMPCPIDVDFENHMLPITGKFEFPLTKIKTFHIDTPDVRIKSRVGRRWFEVKFKRNAEELQSFFNIQIAGYVESKNGIKINM